MESIENRLKSFIEKLDIILKEGKKKDKLIEELREVISSLYEQRLKEKNPKAYKEIVKRRNA